LPNNAHSNYSCIASIKNRNYGKCFKNSGRVILRTPSLESNEEIATIFLDPETKQVSDITIHKENIRFKCRRRATFCCQLGGPELTEKDIQSIVRDDHKAKDFFVPFKGGSESSPMFLGSLKSLDDGSCIFLRFNSKRGNYRCSIYDFRPALCKLYPFDFYKINSQSIMLKLIPCCRGLNNPDGEFVNQRFIIDSLLDAIFALIS